MKRPDSTPFAAHGRSRFGRAGAGDPAAGGVARLLPMGHAAAGALLLGLACIACVTFLQAAHLSSHAVALLDHSSSSADAAATLPLHAASSAARGDAAVPAASADAAAAPPRDARGAGGGGVAASDASPCGGGGGCREGLDLLGDPLPPPPPPPPSARVGKRPAPPATPSGAARRRLSCARLDAIAGLAFTLSAQAAAAAAAGAGVDPDASEWDAAAAQPPRTPSWRQRSPSPPPPAGGADDAVGGGERTANASAAAAAAEAAAEAAVCGGGGELPPLRGLPELRRPSARALMGALGGRLLPLGRPCSSGSGGGGASERRAALRGGAASALGEVQRALQGELREGAPAALVFTRRSVQAGLWGLRRRAAAAWDDQLQALYEGCLLRLYLLHVVSARARGAAEFLHISKSGGTSMCALASANGCANPAWDTQHNCMVEELGDGPKWTLQHTVPVQYPNGTKARVVFAPACSIRCPEWANEGGASCAQREQLLRSRGWSFYSNERTLHEWSDDPGDARACEGFVNVVVLRDPLEHAVSLMGEILRMYQWYPSVLKLAWAFPDGSLPAWRLVAPFAVHSYALRTLLGRAAFCGAGADDLGPPHVLVGQAKVQAMDVVLLLGQDELSDVAFRWGLGWNRTLASTRKRVTGSSARKQPASRTAHVLSTPAKAGGGGGGKPAAAAAAAAAHAHARARAAARQRLQRVHAGAAGGTQRHLLSADATVAGGGAAAAAASPPSPAPAASPPPSHAVEVGEGPPLVGRGDPSEAAAGGVGEEAPLDGGRALERGKVEKEEEEEEDTGGVEFGGGGDEAGGVHIAVAAPRKGKARVAFSPAQMAELADMNALEGDLVDWAGSLLALDVALYEAVEKLAAAAERLPTVALDARGTCWDSLVAEGGRAASAAAAAAASSGGGGGGGSGGGGAVAGVAAAQVAWNRRAAAWLAAQQRAALRARCGFVGLGSDAAGWRTPWRLNVPEQA